MEFCGQAITDTMLIEKTLSTFPVSALMISKNYWIYVKAGRITRFHELIGAMNVAEKHNNILVKNYNARPVGTKPIPESNYSRAPNGGLKERNPKVGTILDILVHMFALKRKEIAKRGVHGTVEVNV